MRVNCTSAVAAAALAGPISTWAGTGSSDSQFWSEADVTTPVATNTTVTGVGYARVSESYANPTLTALGADLNHEFGDLTLTAGYRHQVTRHATGGRSAGQVALVEGTFAPQIGPHTIALRSRVENTLSSSASPWRVRFRAEYRWRTEGLGPISYVFVNDEVFFKFPADGWYRNRAQAGVNLILGKRTNLLVYYQRQDDRLTTPGAINVLGTILKITLD